MRLFRNAAGSRATLTVVAAALLLAVLPGCPTVNRLREAQDSFSRAAEAENADRITLQAQDPAEAGRLDGFASARAGYAGALRSISLLEAESGDVEKLKRDKLWGTALTLKAMCAWRLGDFAGALSAADEALAESKDQLLPRDLALLTAMPGLVKTDEQYRKVVALEKPAADESDADRQAAYAPFLKNLGTGESGAMRSLQKARATVAKGHPVQVYLLQAELAAYRNVLVAHQRLFKADPLPKDEEPRKSAQAALQALSDFLKQAKGDLTIVTFWQKLCLLEAPR